MVFIRASIFMGIFLYVIGHSDFLWKAFIFFTFFSIGLFALLSLSCRISLYSLYMHSLWVTLYVWQISYYSLACISPHNGDFWWTEIIHFNVVKFISLLLYDSTSFVFKQPFPHFKINELILLWFSGNVLFCFSFLVLPKWSWFLCVL